MYKIPLALYRQKKRKVALLVILASAMIGLLSALLTNSLKMLTENYGHQLRSAFFQDTWLIFVLPLTGLTIVWFLRKFLFRNKKNKGITEIFNNMEQKNPLPAYKIPSHYVNGLLTVAFGGSTGIEVSTVVSTAALGSVASQKSSFLKKYKNILTCAGIAAGVTALFNAPIAGILFSLEVFSPLRLRQAQPTQQAHPMRRVQRLLPDQRTGDFPVYFLSLTVSVLVSFFVNYLMATKPVFDFHITLWHLYALPYFVLLGVLAALISVYLTRSVIFFKTVFNSFPKEIMRVVGGSIIISVAIFIFPALYGEGYFAVSALISGTQAINATILLTLAAILLLKPVITAVTLGSGGDGGVFAPSLFIGAFLGYFVALVLNHYFHAEVIPVNFMVIGMAAMLSGSIHAPFTAIFLVCAMVGNYALFVPVLIACLVAKYVAKKILPYSVYSYSKVSKA